MLLRTDEWFPHKMFPLSSYPQYFLNEVIKDLKGFRKTFKNFPKILLADTLIQSHTLILLFVK